MQVTHNNLPEAVSQLCEDMAYVKQYLLQINREPPANIDVWFNLNELCDYLPDRPAKATVYGWVHDGEVPCHKGGKKLRFLKSEIDSWLKEGRRKTNAEAKREAEAHLSRMKK